MAYYIISSKLNGYVLDIEKNKSSAGAHVFMYPKHGGDNQIWFDDPSTGTIRPKNNKKLCLTYENEKLTIDNFKANNKGQQWMRSGECIRNRVDQDQVLDVYNKNKDKGAKVGPYKYKAGADNQQWEFIPVEGHAEGVTSPFYQGQRKDFYIVSEMNGKVLDISGEQIQPGAKIIMFDKHETKKPNQLWYLDNLGLLRSALNDMAPFNKDKGDYLVTAVPNVDPRCQWMIQGNKLISRAGEYMDIRKADKDNGANVISWELNDQENQHWKIVYV